MRFPTLIIVLVLILGVGGLGILVANGTIKLHAAKAEPQKRVVPEGWTLVPISSKALPASTKITRDMLEDPKTGEVITAAIDLKAIPKERKVFVEAKDIIGRVLRHDKRPSYIFEEGDFLPKETHEGPTAQIPPGKRSVTLDASKLAGSRNLRTGDRVDLLAAQAYDPTRKVITSAFAPPNVKGAMVRLLAQNAVVVSPVRLVQVPIANAGVKLRSRPTEEIEIAVAALEVAAVMEAKAEGADLECVVYSGQPEDQTAREQHIVIPPAPTPPPVVVAPVLPPPATVIESIGNKTTVVPLPAAVKQTPPTTAPSPTLTAGGEQR